MRKIFTFIVLFIFVQQYASGQNQLRNPTVVIGELINVIPSLKDWKPGIDRIRPASRTGETLAEQLLEEAEEKMQLRDYGSNAKGDPVVQSAFVNSGNQRIQQPTPDAPTVINQNFDGMGYTGVSPADPNLCSGPSHVIQMINGSGGSAYFKIWDRNGVQVMAQVYMDLLAGAGYNGAGDPVANYDQFANRYVLTEFGFSGGAGFVNTLIVAVSQTADPTGGWYIYKFVDNSYFVDYPKWGIWPTAMYATASRFNTGGTAYLGYALYTFNMVKMRAGDLTAESQYFPLADPELKYRSTMPVNISGPTPPAAGSPGMFVYYNDDNYTGSATDVDSLGIITIQPDFAVPANTVLTFAQSMVAAPFKSRVCPSRNCIPSGSTGYDAISDRIMYRPYYRNFGGYEALVLNHTVDANYPSAPAKAGLRWYELRRTGGPWSIFQQSTYSPDAFSRWMGSININSSGQIALGFNHSGTGVFASVYFTGRNGFDPPGTMSVGDFLIRQGTAYGTFANRWGDYNDLSNDVVDDSLFWFTAMYGNTASSWATRIASFKIGGCANGPAVINHPVNASLCAGGNTSFSITDNAPASPTYQWQVNTGSGFTNITNGGVYSGATTLTLTITGATAGMNGYLYRCNITNTCGTISSNQATLTILAPPSISNHPQTVTLCAGSNNTFSVTAAGGNLTYQWQLSTNGGSTFNDISGATSSSYTVSGITVGMNTYQYRVIVSGSCTPSPATSNAAVLNVVSPSTVTGQPSNASVCDPGNTSFTVAASGSGVIYQWQISTDGGATFNNIANGGIYTGAAAATLNLTGATVAFNGYMYRSLVSNATCTAPTASNASLLTVNTVPSVTAQSSSVILCAGSSNTFTVSATGSGLTYQWQVSIDGGVSYSNIAGATSSSYTLSGITVGMNNNRYRCVVSGTCTPAATSNAAVLTAIAPVAVTTQPASTAICETGNTGFSVAATSVQTISYQWQISTNGGTTWTNIAGATTSGLNLAAVTAGMNNNQYRCLMTSPTCTTPTVTNAAILTVNARPTVTLSASPYLRLYPGLSTTITASIIPSATGFNILWFMNGTLIPGATGTTYTADVTKLGDYRVDIVNTTTGCNNTSQLLTIADSASSKLFIFPSPNDGRFTVSYFNNGGASTSRTVTVYDSKGAKVYNAKFNVVGPYSLLNIDVRPPQTGIYYVVVRDVTGKLLADGKVMMH